MTTEYDKMTTFQRAKVEEIYRDNLVDQHRMEGRDVHVWIEDPEDEVYVHEDGTATWRGPK